MPALQLHAEGKAVVQLVLPPSMLTRINKIALERGVNRSRVIREALQQVYFADLNESPSGPPSLKGDNLRRHDQDKRAHRDLADAPR